MEWLLFVLKKILSCAIYPLGTSLLFWMAGIVSRLRKPRGVTGFVLVLVGGVWLLITSMPITGGLLLRSLEDDAGPYADADELARQGIQYVVVLGGDLKAGELSPADRVACTSLVRLMEGIRLWKRVPRSKLVLSGGSVSRWKMPTAEGMAIMARELGVPPESIIRESESWDTEDEARLLKPILTGKRFALVTSALHMPRSVAAFAEKGLTPSPAPSDFQAGQLAIDAWSFVPSVEGLAMTSKAIHEIVGRGVQRLKRAVRGKVLSSGTSLPGQFMTSLGESTGQRRWLPAGLLSTAPRRIRFTAEC